MALAVVEGEKQTMVRVESLEFGCHCGSWRATLAEPPSTLINCHCGLCRGLSGAAFSTWATVPEDHLTIRKPGPIRHYQVSDNGTRAFCEICGTHVFTVDIRLKGKIGIPAGIILDPNVPALSAHYFVDDKIWWHKIGDSLPCFGGETGYEPLSVDG